MSLNHKNSIPSFNISKIEGKTSEESLQSELKKPEFQDCFDLKITENSIKTFKFQVEMKNMKQLVMTKNQLKQIYNLNQLYNLENLDLSFNLLTEIPEIISLTKLKNYFLNNNQIKKADFDKLKNLEFINLKNNEIKFLTTNDFIENIKILKQSKNLRKFEFEENLYFQGAAAIKKKINNFFKFFNEKILDKNEYKLNPKKNESEFKVKIKEIEKSLVIDSALNKLDEIFYLLKSFNSDANIIVTNLSTFKLKTNEFNYNNCELSEIDEIEKKYEEIENECRILIENVDNLDFFKLLMNFLIKLLNFNNGLLAEDIIDHLNHLAKNKKIEKELVNEFNNQFNPNSNNHIEINANKNEKFSMKIFQEISGEEINEDQEDLKSKKTNKINKNNKNYYSNDKNELKTIKDSPKLLKAFCKIVDENYEDFFVFLFKTLLMKFTYKFLMDFFSLEKLNEKNLESFEIYSIEFFVKCLSGKNKIFILKNLNITEVLKLIVISIGMIRKFEIYLYQNSNNLNVFGKDYDIFLIQNVFKFAKIFKILLKYFFFPLLDNKILYSEHEKQSYRKNFIDIFSAEEEEPKSNNDNDNEAKNEIDFEDKLNKDLIIFFNESDKDKDKEFNTKKISFIIFRVFDKMIKMVIDKNDIEESDSESENEINEDLNMNKIKRKNISENLLGFCKKLYANNYTKIINSNENENFDLNSFDYISDIIASLLKSSLMLKATFNLKIKEEEKNYLFELENFEKNIEDFFLKEKDKNTVYNSGIFLNF